MRESGSEGFADPTIASTAAGVDAVALHDAAVPLHHRPGGSVADALAPSADRDFRAEDEQALGHRPAKPRAAPGDENLLAPEQALLKYPALPPLSDEPDPLQRMALAIASRSAGSASFSNH